MWKNKNIHNFTIPPKKINLNLAVGQRSAFTQLYANYGSEKHKYLSKNIGYYIVNKYYFTKSDKRVILCNSDNQ